MEFLLVILLAVPLFGALVGAFVPTRDARPLGIIVSSATLVISIVLAVQVFSGHAPSFHPGSDHAEFPAIGVSFSLGVNTLSISLVLLTTFLHTLAIFSGFQTVKTREREYYAWLSALLVPMLGVFLARDLLLFYAFFELTLVPMFFIIGIWGGPLRREAAAKFFLYTFAGGVLTLASAVYLGINAHTFAIDGVISFAQHHLDDVTRHWIVCGLLAGFAIKTALFPLHTWLPITYTEAPTGGSILLAGILAKLGVYGLLVIAIPIGIVGPDGSSFSALVHVIAVLAVIGIIYGGLCAWVQPDMKKLVAFSSISHMGFCVLGLMALNDIGMQGSVLYMINHGLSIAAMFLVIGMISDRYNTRDMSQISGLARTMPVLAFFFVLFALSSIGLPGLNGFVSEFLTMQGSFASSELNPTHVAPWYGVFAAFGVILGAMYMLRMTNKVILGPLKFPGMEQGQAPKKNDIGFREIGILVPLAVVIVLLGVCPNLLLQGYRQPIESLQKITIDEQAPAPVPALARADIAVAER